MENKESDYYFNLLCLEQENLRLLKEMELKEKKMETELKEMELKEMELKEKKMETELKELKEKKMEIKLEEKKNKKKRNYFNFDLNYMKKMWKREIDNLKCVIDLYQKYGNKGYIGEEVTQLEHAVQTAMLAENYYHMLPEHLKIEIVLGSFLHDVGHLLVYEDDALEMMDEVGVKDHEEIGGLFLEEMGFSDLICQLVKNHILTKRYLMTTKEDYYDSLSEASKITFKYQGGKLTEEEIHQFERNKYFDYHLRLRDFDDQAKTTEPEILEKIKKLDPINYYKGMIEKYVIFHMI